MTRDIQPFDTAVIRTPALPLQYAFDNALTPTGLLEKFKQSPLFREAIYLASPELYSEVVKNLDKGLPSEKEEEKIVMTLLKYHNRMATRCTPFGLFAGCSTARIGAETQLMVKDAEAGTSHLRFDMHFLCKLTDFLAQQPELKQWLHYHPNTGIYTSGDKLRYYEKYYNGNTRQHKISDVDHSEYLDTLLAAAKGGARFSVLVNSLVSDEITEEEAADFVTEVIDSHLLITELEPAATGRDTLERLIDILQQVRQRSEGTENPFLDTHLQQLQYLRDALSAITQPGHPGNVAAYQHITKRLKEWGYTFEEKYLYQSDLSRPMEPSATIGDELIKKIEAGIAVMAAYSKKGGNPGLAEFKSKFTERYEDAWVPLLEVMDNETGLGYPAISSGGNVPEYLAEQVPGGGGGFAEQQVPLVGSEIPLVKKIIEAQHTGAFEVVLDDKEPAAPVNTALFLSTFNVLASIAGDPASASCPVHFHYAGNNGSAAMLPARFCHTDTAIARLVQSITAKEQELRPDVVYAEIVHFPESRVGNVLLRPVIRDYEIPFLAQSDLPQNRQLPPEDLVVTVKKGRVLLFSKKLNREIVPRLTNAHNFNQKPMPLYQFLCALQYEQQDTTGVMFNLPPIISSLFPFKPRIRWQNIIYREAAWNFSRKETDELVKGETTLEQWRKKWNMPPHIIIADGDNELFLNLENELNQKLFLTELKKRAALEIREMIFAPESAGLAGTGGSSYANEIVISWHKTKIKEAATPEAGAQLHTPSVKSQFIPGEEWLYYKLYCGHRSADILLTTVIHPLTNALLDDGIINGWFFIRYSDPQPHIRLRFRLCNPATGTGKVIHRMMEVIQPWTASKQVNKIQAEAYTRETERYGEATIALAEDLFYIDSLFTVRALGILADDETNMLRWKFALLCIDRLFDNFHYDAARKEELVKKHLAGFYREFGVKQKKVPALENLYRKHKKEIETLFENTRTTPGMDLLLELLEEKMEHIAPIAGNIITTNKAIHKAPSTEDMLWSLVHMMINRLFRSQQRKNEMACYYLLNNYYTSANIRSKAVKEKLVEV